MSWAINLFAIYLENLQATHTLKFVTLPDIYLRMPHEKKKLKLSFTPSHSTFALIKKIFLQTLVEIFFKYNKTLFWDPLRPPTNKTPDIKRQGHRQCSTLGGQKNYYGDIIQKSKGSKKFSGVNKFKGVNSFRWGQKYQRIFFFKKLSIEE